VQDLDFCEPLQKAKELLKVSEMENGYALIRFRRNFFESNE
jgi:hypothetical protein